LKHIVGFSGGIDSQACARYVLNRYPAEDVLICNSNAGGNEHPLTEEFVDWYSDEVHPVVKIEAIVADIWKTPGFAETKGLDGNAPLDFEEMIRIKGRPPSRTAQFCTEILKLKPQKRWIEENFGPSGRFAGEEFRRYSGVRREESEKRRDAPWQQFDAYYDCELELPIFDWTKQMCFDYVKAHGEQINPLYTLGFNRVGCAPCINSSKEDIRAWAERFPEMIDKLRGWEQRTGRTFFAPVIPAALMDPKKRYNTIDQVVEWAFTKRGGREKLVVLDPRPSCESKYGLCA
jgi:3'-phosphoadenosine 5'-phosphosulfate sulfotransferase (PAPS reductase)/FAD synthetase